MADPIFVKVFSRFVSKLWSRLPFPEASTAIFLVVWATSGATTIVFFEAHTPTGVFMSVVKGLAIAIGYLYLGKIWREIYATFFEDIVHEIKMAWRESHEEVQKIERESTRQS